MGSKGKAPKPSQQELDLLTSQKSALDQQQSVLQQQLHQQQLLSPLVYQQLGLNPTYGDIDPATGQPAITGFTQTPEALAQQEAQKKQQELIQQLGQQSVEANQQGLSALQEQQRTANLLLPAQLEQMGYKPTFGEDGKISGIEKLPQTEAQRLQNELQTQFYQRAGQAMRGELPVDPTLQRELDRGGQDLQGSLLKQLGPDYATSSPGIEAQAEYQKRRAEAIYSAQHGEIGAATQGGLQLGGANTRDLLAQFGGGQQALQPGMTTAQSLLGTYGSGVNSPGQNVAQLIGGVSAPYQGGNNLGTLADLYGNASGSYARQRALQAQYQGTSRAGGALGGAAAGAAGGTAIYPGIGTGVGAGIGALLGYFG